MVGLVAGWLAGSVHVLAGPDHLAALAPLAADGRRRAWALGARWGLGHAAGVTLVGALAFGLRGVLPVEKLASAGERLVGVVLVGIGLLGLRAALRHDGVHAHPTSPRRLRAAFAIGLLHGFAGGSHVLGILPALALSRLGALGYVGGFAGGTLLTMAAFTLAVGLGSDRLAAIGSRAHRVALGTCATAAIGVGVVWIV